MRRPLPPGATLVEMADPVITTDILVSLRRHAVHEKDIAKALRELHDRCADEGIPFAVVGALAMQQRGYVRFTEDIDIVTTPAGLVLIHARLVGLGISARGPGLRKKLRDTVNRVNIDVIQSGEHAGSPESPVVYPDPDSADFVAGDGGIRYATLDALIRFKIASGVWGHRPRDLADVQDLVKANALDEGFAVRLPEPLRAKYVEIVEASRLEVDIE